MDEIVNAPEYKKATLYVSFKTKKVVAILV